MTSTTPTPTSVHASPILTLPKNIKVRPYLLSDASSLAHHGTSPALWANLTDRMPQPYTPAAATQWMNFCASPSNLVPSGPWNDSTRTSSGPQVPASYCITIDDVAVGTIGLDFGDVGGVFRRSADLGYWLGEEWWGKGVMSAVVPAFVEWVWETFPVLVRLNGSTVVGNEASGRLLRKAGFEFEGTRKAFHVKNGVVRGEDVYGAVRLGLVLDE